MISSACRNTKRHVRSDRPEEADAVVSLVGTVGTQRERLAVVL